MTDHRTRQLTYFQPCMCYTESYGLEREPRGKTLVCRSLAVALLGLMEPLAGQGT